MDTTDCTATVCTATDCTATVCTAADCSAADSTATVAAIADVLSVTFRTIQMYCFASADAALGRLRELCPPAQVAGGHPDVLARLILRYRPGVTTNHWLWNFRRGAGSRVDRRTCKPLFDLLERDAVAEVKATGRRYDDIAADAGWVISLGVKIMFTGMASDFGVWNQLCELSNGLPTEFAHGVVFTCSTQESWSHADVGTYVFARSWNGQPNARLGLLHNTTQMLFSSSAVAMATNTVEKNTIAHPERTRPPLALVEYAQLIAEDPNGVEATADRLAASGSRAAVAAMVACGCHGDRGRAGEYAARVLRVLSSGGIRPADALAIVIALSLSCSGAGLPASLCNDIAKVLAVQFAAGSDSITANKYSLKPIGELFLPPVIV
jgi:hypothetical protein